MTCEVRDRYYAAAPPSQTPYRLLPEERQHCRRRLVGDRQRLNAELLLCLQRLQAGTFLRQVGVDEVTDTVGQAVRQLGHEVLMDAELLAVRAELGQGQVQRVQRALDSRDHRARIAGGRDRVRGADRDVRSAQRQVLRRHRQERIAGRV